ncbi:hypothetical protein [Nostoc sp. CALU 1950]
MLQPDNLRLGFGHGALGIGHWAWVISPSSPSSPSSSPPPYSLDEN